MSGEKRPVNVTKELLEKAAKCKNAVELMELAKAEGISLTKEEAEAYLADLSCMELDAEMMKKVSGGVCWDNCPSEADCGHEVCGLVGWENFKDC